MLACGLERLLAVTRPEAPWPMAQQVRALPPRTPAISNKSSRLTKKLPTCCKGVSAVVSSTIQSSIPRRPSVRPPRLLGQGRAAEYVLRYRHCVRQLADAIGWTSTGASFTHRSSQPLLASYD